MSVGGLPTAVVLESFFFRLQGLDRILRVITSHARFSAQLTFRGDQTRAVCLDFGQDPIGVSVYDGTRPVQLGVTADAEVMHQILLGRLAPAKAMGRSEFLVRGSALHLSKIIPLLDFSPVMYRDHVADVCAGDDGSRREATMAERTLVWQMGGRSERAWEKVVLEGVNRLGYGFGYCLGLARYRMLKSMSLFEVLGATSRGLAAAIPKRDPDRLDEGRVSP